MSLDVQALIEAFDRLSPIDQHEAFVAINRRLNAEDYGTLDDEALAQIADETFQLYDREEADHASTSTR